MRTESHESYANSPRTSRLVLEADTFLDERFLAMLEGVVRNGGSASVTPILPIGVFGVETTVDFEGARN